MNELLNELAIKTRSSLVDLCWSQWIALGISGTGKPASGRIIDPEALLLFTMEVGRYDPRLFDAVIDWTAKNERWISLQRMKNLTEKWESEFGKRAMIAVARVINDLEKRNRWRSLSNLKFQLPESPIPLFIDNNGQPLPIIGDYDKHFEGLRFLRPPIEIRNSSLSIPINKPEELILKLRSLFGLGPRAELIAYFMTHDDAYPSEVAGETGYSLPPIYQVWSDLSSGGFIKTYNTGFRVHHEINYHNWKGLLSLRKPLPVWIGWIRVFRALAGLLAFLNKEQDKELSEYMLNSQLMTQNEIMSERLAGTGINNPYEGYINLQDSAETFKRRTLSLLDDLTGRSEDSRQSA